jgi:hypothetical protein
MQLLPSARIGMEHRIVIQSMSGPDAASTSSWRCSCGVSWDGESREEALVAARHHRGDDHSEESEAES